MKVEIELTADDMRMVAAMQEFSRRHPKRSAQKWEITPLYRDLAGANAAPADKVFERLKLLGVIDHKRNGYCWLSDAFKAQMRVAA